MMNIDPQIALLDGTFDLQNALDKRLVLAFVLAHFHSPYLGPVCCKSCNTNQLMMMRFCA